ncbi:MAG: phosphodiester glycosidase family protein [Treponema sp.]|nr:phosphodiester glycosidase family protein [Treponema sp.]
MKKTAVKFLSEVLLICLSVFISCTSRPVPDTAASELPVPEQLYIPESFNWKNICHGVDRTDFENTTFPVCWHAVRIDLRTEGIELAAVPGMKREGTEPHAMRTAEFARTYGCTVAVNTSPFTGKKQIVGIHIVQEVPYSPCVPRYSALVFRTVPGNGTYYRASIVDNQTEEAVRNAEYAFGGFFTILRTGNKKEFRVSRYDSRSGAGISEDGQTLYLLVVEGEHRHKSTGLSYTQCASIFKAMGCTDAMEFDGGSSSDLCINGKSVLSYTCRTVQAASFGIKISSPAH